MLAPIEICVYNKPITFSYGAPEMEKITLKTTCYTVDPDTYEIEQHVVGDFWELISIATKPTGGGYAVYVKDGTRVVKWFAGDEWEIDNFETESEAQEKCEELYVQDILNKSCCLCWSRAEAEDMRREWLNERR